MQWALLNGDKNTGVTLFRIAETLDTGDIALQKEIKIEERENAVTLEKKLIPAGISALEEMITQIENGKLKEKAQEGTPSYAPLLKKEDLKIAWTKSAEEIDRQIRALVRLGAYSALPNGKILKIVQAEILENNAQESKNPPGEIVGVAKGKGFIVKCGLRSLLLRRVQLEGKIPTDAWSFLQGSRLKIGEKFL